MKHNPVSDLFEQASKLVGDTGLKYEIESGIKAAVQSALGRMDMVNRDEFDAQVAVLQRTRLRVEQLEKQLITLSRQLEEIEKNPK
tara:strand:+ start:310 stop:567 length:258 start_codon:yes stop_codon:yes gene_type:complete